jgi:hypothetical protein
LAEQALGWLGWTEEQAMSADVNTIEVGMRGKVAMLRAVFGGAEETAPPELPTLTPDILSSVLKR